MPVAPRPKMDWNCRTAVAVPLPKIPSSAIFGMLVYTLAMALSCSCSCNTLAPVEPTVRSLPGQEAGMPAISSAVLMYMESP